MPATCCTRPVSLIGTVTSTMLIVATPSGAPAAWCHTPHLTLARTRVPTDLTPYTGALDGFRGLDWEAGELSLVRSHLPVDGVPGEQPRYEVVQAWPLGR